MKYETGYEEIDYSSRNKKNKEKQYKLCMDKINPWNYGKYYSLEDAFRQKEKLSRSWAKYKDMWVEKLINNEWQKIGEEEHFKFKSD